jgi:serine/threonine protein kinase
MAPEMVLLLSRPPMYGESADKHATRKQIKKGYTFAVDFWSLGITMFKLLTGSRPFADQQMHAIVEMASTLNEVVGENLHFREYAMLFQKVLSLSHSFNASSHYFLSIFRCRFSFHLIFRYLLKILSPSF